jgi:phage N-6-adenine-methyltransferase
MRSEAAHPARGKLWKKAGGAIGFSSKSRDWTTPQEFFDKLNKGFDFTLDPCATAANAKCKKYFTEDQNGLEQSWKGHRVFVNPPYGRNIGEWIKKGYKESKQHNTVVVILVPARTDTRWWHDYVMKAKEVHLVRGRLKFGSSDNAAPFPSAIAVFHSNTLYRALPRLAPELYPMERL